MSDLAPEPPRVDILSQIGPGTLDTLVRADWALFLRSRSHVYRAVYELLSNRHPTYISPYLVTQAENDVIDTPHTDPI